jgi:hypothetical protein
METLQEKMFADVEAWHSSQKRLTTFLRDKNYSKGKFYYWLEKWNLQQGSAFVSDFREIKNIEEHSPFVSDFREVKNIEEHSPRKVLEIQVSTHVKVTIFA